MALGNRGEYDILRRLFSGISIPTRNTLWVGLSSGAPEEDGSEKWEFSGDGYARIKITGSTKFSAASAGSITTASVITFPTATADWGTATHFFIDTGVTVKSTANSILAWGTLEIPKTIQTNDVASFQAGELTISLD